MNKVYYKWGTLCCTLLLLVGCGGHASHDGHDHDEHSHGGHVHGSNCAHGTEEEAHVESNALFGEIILEPEQAKAAGVEAAVITPKSFRKVIATGGQILSAQGDEMVVVANVAGVVSFRKPLTDGVSVSKGASLLSISSRQMQDGDPAERARIAYQAAKQEYERAASLVESKIVSEKEFVRIKEAYENARLSYEAFSGSQSGGGVSVPAPMEGYIKNSFVSEGDYVSVGQPLLSITRNRRLFLQADVSEKYYGALSRIVSANFRTSYDKNVYELSEMNGKLVSYGRTSGDNSYFIPVTFEFDNKGDVLPGSYVEVYLLSDEMPDVLAVPYTALTEEQGAHFIYRQIDEEGYLKQEVTLGANNGKEVQILSGINSGDRVVVRGAYQVRLASVSNAIPHGHEH